MVGFNPFGGIALFRCDMSNTFILWTFLRFRALGSERMACDLYILAEGGSWQALQVSLDFPCATFCPGGFGRAAKQNILMALFSSIFGTGMAMLEG